MLALHLLPEPAWREAAAGGWCSTSCCCELVTCVEKLQSQDLMASPFPVPLCLTTALFEKVLAIWLKPKIDLASKTM